MAKKLETVAEASGYTKTSSYDDVIAFLRKLRALPHAERLRQHVFGETVEGRKLPLVTVSDEPLPEDEAERRRAVLQSGKLRILVNANIHAGEVEGKEAVLMLLRELGNGEHADLLRDAILLLVPIYNADGNERVDPKNRVDQNGPDGGVGQRPNADGFDLNRDFVKLVTPEGQALVALWEAYDPHVFMDLHTTNGSHHGYHLTYAPSLAVNVDPKLDRFTRQTLLPAIRRSMAKAHAFRVYDYGNFAGRGDERRWETYDHRPRFATNYFGLRNRIAVLSEAYSYLTFEERVKVTRAFVIETLRAAVANAGKIRELCAAADARVVDGAKRPTFGFASQLEEAWEDTILVGSVKRQSIPGAGTRLVATPDYQEVKMPVQLAFVAMEARPMPAAWALRAPRPEVVEKLLQHGLDVQVLAEPWRGKAKVFAPSRVTRARREFQGQFERALEGDWREQATELAAGTIVVRARQRLGRVAAQLLEPESEDSLATWGFFDAELEKQGREQPPFPVLRLAADEGLVGKRVAGVRGGKLVLK